MGTKRTMAELRAQADDLYGDYEIDLGNGKALVLRPLLRLPDAEQNKAYEMQGRLNALLNGETVSDNATSEARSVLHKLIRLFAATKSTADLFLKMKDAQDLVFLTALFQDYKEATQLGEATDSPS